MAPALPKSKRVSVNTPTARVAPEVIRAIALIRRSSAFGTNNIKATPSIGKNVPTLSSQLSSRSISIWSSPSLSYVFTITNTRATTDAAANNSAPY